MFMRIDQLQAELPQPKKPDPNAAAALQELLGGKYEKGADWGVYVVTDGTLVTGQNPASSERTAETLLALAKR